MGKINSLFSILIFTTFFVNYSKAEESTPTPTAKEIRAEHFKKYLNKKPEGTVSENTAPKDFKEYFDFFCENEHKIGGIGAGNIVLNNIMNSKIPGEEKLDQIAEEWAFNFININEMFNNPGYSKDNPGMRINSEKRKKFSAFLVKLGIPTDLFINLKTIDDIDTLKRLIRKQLTSYTVVSDKSPYGAILRFENGSEISVEATDLVEYGDNPLFAGEDYHGKAQGQKIYVKNFSNKKEGDLCKHDYSHGVQPVVDCVQVKNKMTRLEGALNRGEISKEDFDKEMAPLKAYGCY